ncbi:MAG: ATP-binding protein [Pseudomonadota bacterium]|nr:ATP-binding protein [Pseudomonadota bacterium]
MIDILKRKLLIRYALILFGVSLFIFCGGYAAYRIISKNVIFSSLYDYLQEEIFEFRQNADALSVKPERVAVAARNNALHFFSYGFLNGKMLRLEQPEGDAGNQLTEKVSRWDKPDGKITVIKVKSNGQRWRFLALSESWTDEENGRNYQVVALLNITPYIYITHRYKSYGLVVVCVLCLLSLLAASLLANNAVKPIAEAYRRQKEFVSDASHELKTPLSVLLTYTEILQKQPQNKTALQVMRDETKNMSDLVENLLALTRLENIKKITGQEQNVSKILFPLTEQLNAVHHQRTEPATAVCPENITVKMAEQHLKRLLTILLDNAFKYTPEDKKIKVCVSTDEHKTKITVTDEGIGIKADDLPHIFERFYRVDKGRNRQKGGFGLGLSLAQDIVQKYQGQIKVKSQEGKGTSFIVLLPH